MDTHPMGSMLEATRGDIRSIYQPNQGTVEEADEGGAQLYYNLTLRGYGLGRRASLGPLARR